MPVTEINSYAFSGCTGLTSVIFQDGVDRIDQDAFNGCYNLKFLLLPGGMDTIERNAFYGCYNLQKVFHKGTPEDWDWIVIKSGNDALDNATIIHNFTDDSLDNIVHTVVFQDWDGTVLSFNTYDWGDEVIVPASPTREADNTYTYTFAGWDKTVVVNCAGDATYTATYTASSRAPNTITSSQHTVSSGTISKIEIGTTVDTLLGNISESSYAKVYQGNKEVANDALIGTGMTVKIMDGNTVKATATVVVTGDTNGDGKLTVTDMLAVKAHLLKKNTLSGASGTLAYDAGQLELTGTSQKIGNGWVVEFSGNNFVAYDNNDLSDITVDGFLLSPVFSGDNTKYVIWLPYETESVTVNGIVADSKASVRVEGGSELKAGQDNEIKVICTAEDGTEKVYSVIAKRATAHDGSVDPTEPTTEPATEPTEP